MQGGYPQVGALRSALDQGVVGEGLPGTGGQIVGQGAQGHGGADAGYSAGQEHGQRGQDKHGLAGHHGLFPAQYVGCHAGGDLAAQADRVKEGLGQPHLDQGKAPAHQQQDPYAACHPEIANQLQRQEPADLLLQVHIAYLLYKYRCGAGKEISRPRNKKGRGERRGRKEHKSLYRRKVRKKGALIPSTAHLFPKDSITRPNAQPMAHTPFPDDLWTV